jgi:hypothetical protein
MAAMTDVAAVHVHVRMASASRPLNSVVASHHVMQNASAPVNSEVGNEEV